MTGEKGDNVMTNKRMNKKEFQSFIKLCEAIAKVCSKSESIIKNLRGV